MGKCLFLGPGGVTEAQRTKLNPFTSDASNKAAMKQITQTLWRMRTTTRYPLSLQRDMAKVIKEGCSRARWLRL